MTRNLVGLTYFIGVPLPLIVMLEIGIFEILNGISSYSD